MTRRPLEEHLRLDGAPTSLPPARPAATVIVARPAFGEGIEVLVLRRAKATRFGPGFVVFPGGVVEPEDALLAGRWFSDPAEEARACAVRELAEETGLVLTRTGLVTSAGAAPGGIGFPAPRRSDLVELARWVAPEFLPVRFDARFFGVAAPRDLQPHPDGVEVDRAWWARPADLLRPDAGFRDRLMWPTLKMLEALSASDSVPEAMSLRVPQVPPPRPG